MNGAAMIEQLHISDQVVALCAAHAYTKGGWLGSTHLESDLIDRLHAAGYEIVRSVDDRRSTDRRGSTAETLA